jgi:hypothetical protein
MSMHCAVRELTPALNGALDVLDAKARFEGLEHPVFVRVAGGRGEVYLDLANAEWQCVRVTREGWTVEKASAVKFRRPSAMESLPLPQAGGALDLLRKFVNVASSDFPLYVGFLPGALRPTARFWS